MRQTLVTITCDRCGTQQTFEIANVNAHGPIIATRDVIAMTFLHKWSQIGTGLRTEDICERCRNEELKLAKSNWATTID